MAKVHELRVEKIASEDSWKDIVRIKKDFRKDVNGRHIKRGSICRLTCCARSRWVIVHGRVPEGNIIEMDLTTRLGLKVDYGTAYDFKLTRIAWPRSLWFPWKASDPMFRIPAQLALISFFLGVILGVAGILVGFVPIYNDYRKEHRNPPTSTSSAVQAIIR